MIYTVEYSTSFDPLGYLYITSKKKCDHIDDSAQLKSTVITIILTRRILYSNLWYPEIQHCTKLTGLRAYLNVHRSPGHLLAPEVHAFPINYIGRPFKQRRTCMELRSRDHFYSINISIWPKVGPAIFIHSYE